ncbi:MAG: helix-turn-helix domain-containing protein [Lysobacterales bacterium]|jgi:AraC-like DNA-binding protein
MLNRIEPSCVEELNQVVVPWQLTLRQLSRGERDKRVRFRALQDTIISNECWSSYILGHGGTARDYVTVAGNNAELPVYWQGETLGDNRLAVAPANVECEFHTPDGADHWVLLIPRDRFTGYFGVDSETELIPRAGLVNCEPQAFRRLASLANGLLDDSAHRQERADDETLQDLICSRVADALDSNGRQRGEWRVRYAHFRRALAFAEAMPGKLSVQQLADAAGVSRRVLELAFRENLGIAPHRVLKLIRLNKLHTDLLAVDPQQVQQVQQVKVTEQMRIHGFDEFGRTAGEFRDLFGERPMELLNRPPPVKHRSFLQATAAA